MNTIELEQVHDNLKTLLDLDLPISNEQIEKFIEVEYQYVKENILSPLIEKSKPIVEIIKSHQHQKMHIIPRSNIVLETEDYYYERSDGIHAIWHQYPSGKILWTLDEEVIKNEEPSCEDYWLI